MTIDENIDPVASDVKFHDFVRRWDRAMAAADKIFKPLIKEANEAGYVWRPTRPDMSRSTAENGFAGSVLQRNTRSRTPTVELTDRDQRIKDLAERIFVRLVTSPAMNGEPVKALAIQAFTDAYAFYAYADEVRKNREMA